MKETILRLCESCSDVAAEIGVQAEAMGELDALEAARAVVALQEAQGRLNHARDALATIASRQAPTGAQRSDAP